MNATCIPAFTAEASLDRGEARYRAATSFADIGRGGGGIEPSARPIIECSCTGNVCCCCSLVTCCCCGPGGCFCL